MAGGAWTEEQLGGHPCDIYQPSQRSASSFVVLYLHGMHLDRLVDNAAFVEQFERYGLPVVAPHTRRSWWTNRICREFDRHVTAERYVLDTVVPFLERRFETRSKGIGLLGTSMGGQGALRFSYKYPQLFPLVAAISPVIEYDRRFFERDDTVAEMYPDSESARHDTATFHISAGNPPLHQFFCCDPADKRWWKGADQLRKTLINLGIPHESDLATTAGGHGFQYYNHMAARAVSFLVEAADHERASQ